MLWRQSEESRCDDDGGSQVREGLSNKRPVSSDIKEEGIGHLESMSSCIQAEEEQVQSPWRERVLGAAEALIGGHRVQRICVERGVMRVRSDRRGLCRAWSDLEKFRETMD